MPTQGLRLATRVSRLLVIFCCLAAPQAMAADYWNLGTFSDQDNALRERDRINSLSSLETMVVSAGAYYRVVLEKDSNADAQKALIEDLGISPWTFSDDTPAVVSAKTVTVAAEAVDGYYLVLASFNNDASAGILRDRMQADGIDGLDVIAADVNGQTYYRVVQGPHSGKTGVDTDYSAYGIDGAWWMSTGDAMAATASEAPATDTWMAADDEETAEAPPVEAAPEEAEPEPVYAITPPSPNENYVRYCLEKANAMERAIYCKNNAFLRIGSAESRANGSTKQSALLGCALGDRADCED